MNKANTKLLIVAAAALVIGTAFGSKIPVVNTIAAKIKGYSA